MSFVNTSVFKLLLALILILSSSVELFESFDEIGSHHGVFIFGIAQALGAVADMMAAAEEVS